MGSFSVTVSTGSQWFAGTDDYVYLSLVGSARTSERHLLDKPFYNDFERGAIDTYEVSVTEELGEIQLIKIEKRKYWFPDDWYLKYVTVKTPNGDYLEFPCYRWITDEKEVVLRDGQAKLFGDDKTHVLKNHRRKELEERQKLYRERCHQPCSLNKDCLKMSKDKHFYPNPFLAPGHITASWGTEVNDSSNGWKRIKGFLWAEWHPGFPLNIDAKTHKELPRNIQFDSEKGVDFILNYTKAMENLCVNRFMHMFQSSWSDFADFEKIFVRISNTISGKKCVLELKKHSNFEIPALPSQFSEIIYICKCECPGEEMGQSNRVRDAALAGRFHVWIPVSEWMQPCIDQKVRRIAKEIPSDDGNGGMQFGEEPDPGGGNGARNIFLVDYELLDGVEVNKTDPCTMQYLAAPVCLLYRNLEKKIVPIAIQISQEPKPDNPIFLPSDAKYDWLLAKIWVRSSDFHIHQTVTHLLRTHLVSEVFAVAVFRQLPAVHPLFKLLIPHVRFTIAINTKAREQLICEYGLFDKANATGGGGHVEMVQRAMRDLTYGSLCFPEEIKARQMESDEDIPYYYYRDDGLRVWDAIKSFVTDVVSIYYKSDEVVCEDVELQAFVKDIYVYGMRGNKSSGFPKAIKTREKLSEYLTVVVFRTSAQHAAVNFGQVFLGMYPDEHFIEKPVKEAMKKFRKNLDDITSDIAERNRNKKLPYYYLSPDQVPNSVAV